VYRGLQLCRIVLKAMDLKLLQEPVYMTVNHARKTQGHGF